MPARLPARRHDGPGEGWCGYDDLPRSPAFDRSANLPFRHPAVGGWMIGLAVLVPLGVGVGALVFLIPAMLAVIANHQYAVMAGFRCPRCGGPWHPLAL